MTISTPNIKHTVVFSPEEDKLLKETSLLVDILITKMCSLECDTMVSASRSWDISELQAVEEVLDGLLFIKGIDE